MDFIGQVAPQHGFISVPSGDLITTFPCVYELIRAASISCQRCVVLCVDCPVALSSVSRAGAAQVEEGPQPRPVPHERQDHGGGRRPVLLDNDQPPGPSS